VNNVYAVILVSLSGGGTMALSILKYSSANAKARALFGKLLTKADYEELLGKRSVHEVAAYLKKHAGYGTVLSKIDESMIHRAELEHELKTTLYVDFIKLHRFLGGTAGEFLKAAFFRFEVEDLKMLFRIVYTGERDDILKNSLIFLKTYSELSLEKLSASKDISGLIEALRGSEYYKVLSPFLNVSNRQDLFDIEIALDLHYFMKILRLKEKLLSGADRKSVTNTFGTEIDITNILMIYRCKRLFNMDKELTFKYVIPYWHHLTRSQLISLSESSDVNEFKAKLSKTRYAGIFNPDEENVWEINSMNYMYRMYRSQLHQGSFNLGTVTAYLHLKEIDIKNIITLIEGIRYRLPKDEIRSYLIGQHNVLTRI